MIKNILIPFTILIIIIALILSCTSEEDPAGRLAGSWNVTTDPTTGIDHNGGSFNITYEGSFTMLDYWIYVYSGDGTLGGQSFYILVNESVPAIVGSNFFVDFRRDSDTDMVNLIMCSGTVSGNSANGEYYGESGGAYDGDTGTIVATKQ
jgi:hypothetical protein